MQDLTERRSHEQHLQQVAQEHLRAVTDSMRDAECTLDGDGHLIHMNPAAQRLLGWNVEDLRGRTLHDAVHDDPCASGLASEDCALHVATHATAPTQVDDDAFARRDGSRVPVSWMMTPVEGASVGHQSVIVFNDSTASKLAHAQLLLEEEQLAQVRELSDALAEERFELFAQPIVDLATGATLSHELLLRMRERDGAIRTPASLLPAAEASGLICDLDRWVLRKGAQLAGEGHRVELNLSAASLDEPRLFDDFARALAEYDAEPGLIVIELTETALIQDREVATTFIERVRALGCGFALDDFGTGFGGFSYIKHLPVDYLKIDIEFVRDLHTNTASQHVVQAVVQLAGAFGQRTIAEGVEEAQTLELLREMGVDYAQGYLLGRPGPLATTLHGAGESPSPSLAGRDRADAAPAPTTDGAVAVPTALPRRRHGDVLIDRLARAYLDTLRVGDPHGAAAVIDDALRSGLPCIEIQARVIAPAMRVIGELWERDGLTVAQEHLATAVSHHVLARLYPGLLRRTPRRGDTVVVAAAQGEHHILGLRMVADVFEGAGFDVRFLGADVPSDSLASLIAEHRPAIVALGITMPLAAATLVRQLQQLRERDPQLQLIVGGQGVPAVLQQGAGVLYAADTEQLSRYVNGGFAALPPAGELPDGIARGGVQLPRFAGANDVTDGLESLLAQTTAAAADAARGQARRSFMLEQLAFRDPLTDLWNRRAFDDRYDELTRVDCADRAPTILMIDIDRFKSVNDEHGHDAGDRALVSVARSITRALRPDDFAARYGGDEFVVLLPDTTPQDAARIGERIRGHVEADLTAPPLTVSIGIAAPDHSSRRRATLDVDRALYQAKEGGRNQVAFA